MIEAAGGVCLHADGSRPSFNRAEPKLPNLLGARAALLDELMEGWLVATRR